MGKLHKYIQQLDYLYKRYYFLLFNITLNDFVKANEFYVRDTKINVIRCTK